MGTFRVVVTYPSGQKAGGVKVAASVMQGAMIETRTNSDGIAILSWGSDNSLDAIFVDGKRYDGPYRSGGSEMFNK